MKVENVFKDTVTFFFFSLNCNAIEITKDDECETII